MASWTAVLWSDVLASGTQGLQLTLPSASRSDDSIIKLLPSNGSTGEPKLVPVTEKMLREGEVSKGCRNGVDGKGCVFKEDN